MKMEGKQAANNMIQQAAVACWPARTHAAAASKVYGPAGCCCKPLPLELWTHVFVHLASMLEPPGGLRGPAVVAADLLRGGLACRDTLQACRTGLHSLAVAVPVRLGVPPLPPLSPAKPPATGNRPEANVAAEPDWALLDGLLAQPTTCSEMQLQCGLRLLQQPTEGSRADLVLRLRALFQIAAGSGDAAIAPADGTAAALAATPAALLPPLLPARLCTALRQERDVVGCGSAAALSVRLAAALRDMLEAGDGLAGAALAQPSLAAMRRDLCALYGSTEGLLAAHRACLPRLLELRLRREEERRWAVEEWRRDEAARAEAVQQDDGEGGQEQERRAVAVQLELEERAAALRRSGVAVCVCGRLAARACPLLLCCECCQRYGMKRAPCPRHTAGAKRDM